jgi:hypothetical protein
MSTQVFMTNNKINNKVFIGHTTVINLENVLKTHIHRFRTYGITNLLYQKLNDINPINFRIRLLERADVNNKNELKDTLHKYYIQYDTVENGLNGVYTIISSVKPETSVKHIETSIKPIETSVKPIETSIKSTETSVNPIEILVKPMETSVNPIETSVKPTETSVKPIETSDKPIEISKVIPEIKTGIDSVKTVKPIEISKVIPEIKTWIDSVKNVKPEDIHHKFVGPEVFTIPKLAPLKIPSKLDVFDFSQ